MMNELIRNQHINHRRRFSPLPLKSPRFRLAPTVQNLNSLSRFSRPIVRPERIPEVRWNKVLSLLVITFVVPLIAGFILSPWPARSDSIVLPADLSNTVYLKSYIQQGLRETSEMNEGESIPLALTEQFAWQTYRVRNGDTLLGIAKNFNISIDAIIALNGITNARSLRSGTLLKIPNMDGIPYTVKKGDSLSKISKSWGIPIEAILDANDVTSDIINPGTQLFLPGARLSSVEIKRVMGNLFVYPINGRLTSTYGWRNDPFTGVRRFHAAIDLAQDIGVPVGASMNGKVLFTGFNTVYGNYIILSHEGGYQTMYAHLDSILVKKGERVVQKQRIGTVGNTGYSTGPHLHFAIFKNGRAMNPLELLGK
jgi:murein DD-endopeptidase MepM/ murein hydrolase activator NlpD